MHKNGKGRLIHLDILMLGQSPPFEYGHASFSLTKMYPKFGALYSTFLDKLA